MLRKTVLLTILAASACSGRSLFAQSAAHPYLRTDIAFAEWKQSVRPIRITCPASTEMAGKVLSDEGRSACTVLAMSGLSSRARLFVPGISPNYPHEIPKSLFTEARESYDDVYSTYWGSTAALAAGLLGRCRVRGRRCIYPLDQTDDLEAAMQANLVTVSATSDNHVAAGC